MPRFACRVGTSTGSIQSLEVDEETREAARRSLEAKGYFVFSIDGQGKGHFRGRLSAIGSGRIGARNLVVFNQELLALVKAGLPILTSLDLLSERTQQPRLRILLYDIREAVKGGAAL